MDKCSCSGRGLAILKSEVVMREGIPYQVLSKGCDNKNCPEYHKAVKKQYINLLDTTQGFEENV